MPLSSIKIRLFMPILALFTAFIWLSTPASAQNKSLRLEGKTFELNGRTAFLILPPKADTAKGPIPWVWYAPTLLPKHPDKAEKWMFDQWLSKGIAIAGMDVGESYGSPTGRAHFTALYKELTENRGFAKKACMLARSRGGLMLYNWAVENPEKIAGIAALYPVCNLESYPGLKRASGAYEMTAEELKSVLASHNPIERLAPLAKEKVPLYHIHGDNDKVVPLEHNSGIMAERYKEFGAPMTLKVIKDGGHDMKDHWFKDQGLVDFIIKQSGK